MRALRYPIAALAALFMVIPAQARAGLHMSPSSPAGQEYVLPLASARTFGGAPLATSVAGTTPPALPFGAGIRPAAVKNAGDRDRAEQRRGRPGRGEGPGVAGDTSGGPPDHSGSSSDRIPSGFLASFADGSLDLLLVAVLAVAIALAVLLRRRGRAPGEEVTP